MRRNNRNGNDEENVNEGRRRITTLRYNNFIVPDHYFTHLKYVERKLVLCSASVSGVYVYGGNDCFHPDKTGTGHQPMGFDQLTALYTRFRVHSSKIRLWYVNGTTGFQYGCIPSNSTTMPVTFQDMEESPYSKWKVAYTNVGYDVVVENDISTKEIVGIKSVDEDDQFAGSSTAVPGRQWYWVIHSQVYDNATSATLLVNAEIEYDVEFFDRVQTSSS